MKGYMDYQRFCEKMQKAIKEGLPDNMRVEVHKVMKNNSIELDGLIIISDNENVSPSFYLQIYYEQYKSGETIECLAQKIRDAYYEEIQADKCLTIDMSFEYCKERIVFRLVSYEMNREIMKTIPYVQFLDMIVIFYILFRQDEDGIGSVRVTNKLMQQWQLNTEAIFSLAKENTRILFPKKICSMSSLMADMLNGETEPDFEETFNISDLHNKEENEPYVITNEIGINGAAVMLYPDILEEVGLLFGGDYYLLPSSIHEMLAISVETNLSVQELRDMVCEVNKSCVAREEVLSNKIYYYSCITNAIKICKC